MISTIRPQFSVRTLILLVTIAALLLSNFAMWRRVRQARSEAEEARAEVEETRKCFGYLDIGDPQLIHMVRIGGEGIRRTGNWGNSYRLYIPPGHRFLLNIAETEIPDFGDFPTPAPAKMLSMNTWSDGADVILHWDVKYDEQGTPHLKVATVSEELFDYPIKGWKKGAGLRDGAQLPDTQMTFRPDEEIKFAWFRDVSSKKGVIFWMEPVSKRFPE